MKHYKNTLERILGTIQEQIYNYNEDVRNYGHTSVKVIISISKSILNATLYALVISNVVYRNFYFHYQGQIITGLDLSVDGHICFVSENDYEIYD